MAEQPGSSGTDGNDVIDALAGDDTVSGGAGHDTLHGGYGNDRLDGGSGNDSLDGGRGSDLLLGGDGDDLLISRSDAGEQRIGQLAIGEPTREDPNNEVNELRQKLYGWEDQPLVGDDFMVGGAGRDTFLIAPQINGKSAILERNVRSDGTIDWSMHGVAGENDALHDHWVDSIGIDVIADYNAQDDHVAVIGHTARVEVEHVDVDGDGDTESLITIYSQQGSSGGAHAYDLIGQVVVFGDVLNAADIVTDAGVTYGIVDTFAEVQEAVNPQGELKTSEGPGGETIIGYDTRDDAGNLGEVTGNPYEHVDNPFAAEVVLAAPSDEVQNNSRAHFEPLGFEAASNDTINGTDGADVLRGDAPVDGAGMPAPLAFWSFAQGAQGAFEDARGGPQALAYQLYENQALLQVDTPTRPGPDGTADSALEFNGQNSFAFIAHDPVMEVTQGTVSLWIQPDDLSDDAIILSKDQSGTGEGGHFRLGFEDNGRLFVRFAEGDGGSNKAWVSSQSYLSEGSWTHVAVSFTASGITVYADGVAIPDYGWARQEGNLDSPAQASEAYLLQNEEPWLLGTDTSRTQDNDTAAQFAADDEHLDDAFDGAIAQFGLWGGFSAEDALDAGQVWSLFTQGPGDALSAPAVSTAIAAGNDIIDGGDGNDVLSGDGGNDELRGGAGHDELNGGYGDDVLEGGAGNDVLEGGRGSDLLLGGDGDDTLVSRSDAGEQRIGQLAIGEPTREDPDNEVNALRQKLYGWEDQPLVGDDIMVGGAGRDTFLFNPQLNAKRDIILEHVNDDRSIDWANVAGENNALHDHWVDSHGIDVIADYRVGEDTIAIVGHTATPEVEHRLIDTDGDGVDDEAISIISVYSNQGNGGGAHTADLIGQIVVHGDLVDVDDIVREARVTHGIVETVDELQEALAPSGTLKQSTLSDGTTAIGYDTRDDEGNLGEVTGNPHLFVDNPYLNSGRFEFASNVPDDVPQAVAVIDGLSHPELDAMVFSGEGHDGAGSAGVPGAYVNIAHAERAAGLAQTSATVAFTFVADAPGEGWQALFSKDARNYVDGGHLTAWVTSDAHVKVRYQSSDETRYLYANDIDIVAGEAHHFAFSFDGTHAVLYIDGIQRDVEDLSDNAAFAAGMSGNTESLVFGASTTYRNSGELDHLHDYFDGSIDDVVIADRVLHPVEVLQLANADGDFGVIGLDSSHDVNTPADQGLQEAPPETTTTTESETTQGVDEVQTVSVATLGTADADDLQGTDGNDVIDALAGDDTVSGGAGHDTLHGGYGNDRLDGGSGNDSLDGGRGSDLLLGGDGDDLLISRSDAGEQRIGQLAIGEPTREDPNNEVNELRQKLYGWEDQPLVGDDFMVGGAGRDTFLIAPQINGKSAILERNVRSDGTIDWSMHGVAGENDALHDHWVDSIGIDVIADYNAQDDHVAVIGHTARVEVEHVDVDGDGDTESLITIYSQQGSSGGAHAYDLIGQVVVFGDVLNAADIVTDAGVTYGIVDTFAEVQEAVNPQGELKTSEGSGGETIIGYDTRDDAGNLGEVTGNPYEHVDNPFAAEVVLAAPSDEVQNNSRAHFEPLGFEAASNDTINGTDGADVLRGDAPVDGAGMPAPLAFWSFAQGAQGAFEDARGGPQALAYQLYENQALLQVDTPTRPGPDGTADSALEFNGQNSFAFIAHDPVMEVTQGTVSLWIQPDDLSDDAIILSKDQSGTGEGGHFRLGFEDNGRLFVRFAEGDGGSNKAWVSSQSYLSEGSWTHVAVSFTASGITVYADGVAIPDYGWARQEGNLDSPAQASEAYLLQNEEPWLLGTDTSRTQDNDTAAQFAADDEHLDDAFDGAIAQFGLWGGFSAEDALDAGQVWSLFTQGPGDALSAPAVSTAIAAGNDIIDGGDGNDVLSGDGGNDELRGGAGHDELNGGYGDDVLEGGAGNDVLEGGRGSDLLLGGDGDDTLVSRSDAGEQRIGQLAIGEPTREDPDNEVNALRQKLYGWEDQPLVGDDIMVGGAGRDTFLFNPQLNAKRDIILEHVNDDRSIDWANVAGENNALHDHWVDSHGIDVIADYRVGEDTIAIVGHTATPEVEHRLIDTDGDGVDDEAISIISVYSNQGNGGGAHTADLIGQIVVHGDLVDVDDIVREARVTHGIVETVDELQEALAPSGTLKQSTLSDGTTAIGYDTRDDEGNLGEVTGNPHLFVDNPYLNSGRFEFASNVPDDVPQAVAVIDGLSHPELDAMVFSGEGHDGAGSAGVPGAYVNIAHAERAAGLAQTSATVAFTFVADAPGEGWQALFSKDARNYVDGGHLTAWVTSDAHVKVRYQSSDETRYLYANDIDIVAGEAHHFAFSFDGTHAVLYIDGIQRDVEDLSDNAAFAAGMSGNTESLVFGASTTYRNSGELDHLHDYFDGSIDDVVVLDRILYGAEAFQLASGVLDYVATDDEPAASPSPAENLNITGSDADDMLAGDTGDDVIDGAKGNDEIDGDAGDDRLIGGSGDDNIQGGDGSDYLYGNSGKDLLSGGEGDDQIDGGSRDDVIHGDGGNDSLFGQEGSDELHGGLGNDQIRGNASDDLAFGGDGDDYLHGGSGHDELHGGNGNDRIFGGIDDDVIHGDGGNDSLFGQDGNDELHGGLGNDQIRGNASDDLAFGDDGDDFLHGGSGHDELHGGNGNDRVFGGIDDDVIHGDGGNDSLFGQDGNDELHGGSGDDRIFGGIDDDVIHGDGGNDSLFGQEGSDELHGGLGNDQIRGNASDDLAFGGDGDDYLHGGSGHDELHGGNGNDRIFGGIDDDVIHGDGGNDSLFGQDGNDELHGGLGNDQIRGNASDDLAFGDDGDDFLHGGSGHDELHGGNGKDRIFGGIDDDVIHGDGGDDSLFGQDGNDELHGGLGNDQIRGNASDDLAFGDDGDDYLHGGSGHDELHGGNGNDRVFGGIDDDVIHGDGGNDSLFGQDGNDELHGGLGNDVIHGGGGRDFITGGAGNDDMIGGGGRDVFVFQWLDGDGGLGMDVIRDFSSAKDDIYVADDLLIQLDDAAGSTRMTLSSDSGEVVGVVDFHSSSIDELNDIFRIDASGDILI